MATTALIKEVNAPRKEGSVTAHNLQALNLLYLIHTVSNKPTPLQVRAFTPVDEHVASAKPEAAPDFLFDHIDR